MSLDDLTKLDQASTVRFGSLVNAEEVESLFAYIAAQMPAEVRYSVELDKRVGPAFSQAASTEGVYTPEVRRVSIKGDIALRGPSASFRSLFFSCLGEGIEMGDTEVTRFYGLKFDTVGRDRLSEVPEDQQALMQRMRQVAEEYFLQLRAKPESDE